MDQCGSCPLLGSTDPRDLSNTIWRNRMGAFRKLDIHVVCTTHWMAEKVRASSLLGKKPVSVIPNTVPLDIFYPMRREALRKDLSFAENDFVMMFSSQSLTNYRKGGQFILEALHRIADGPDGKRTKVLLLGQHPDEAFFKTGIDVIYCGYLTDMQQLAVYYNAADVFLFPSLEEAFGQVTAEAAACGTPTVAFAAGGIPETIEHGVTGWLAPTGSLEGLLEGIRWAKDAAGDPKMRKRCRILAMERWSPEKTTHLYAGLFRELAEKD
ncbi:hypothetical protein KL86DPRO_11436 [uncultured delta proteobacterium]|uniref:Uncharacterized protein n=1 Tax=uncultured delta proteobacterium TaxID=34034 RepID=A0A212JGY3_9DELT|nr:hypothetical protein KL86DPRO_11436 [uncultured delta proteobacterium]